MTDRAAELRQQLIRNFHEAPREPFKREPLYESESVRLCTGTVAKQLGASFDIVPPGKRSCPYHFLVVQGEGSLRVAGEQLPIKAGDVIVIPAGPEYPHQIINTSAAHLHYLSISTQEKVEICEYPDSGKLGAFAPGVRQLQRREAGVDYWDGEP
jgi:uncharacterized cupin superfamily protein